MLTRKSRTQNYIKQLHQDWLEYFWDSVHNYFAIDSNSFHNLSHNVNITLDTILKNPQYNWCYDEISCNPNINFTIVKNTPFLKWNYHLLSKNPSITWNDILSSPDLPWDWRNLAEKPGISMETVRKHFYEMNPKLLIHNPSITLDLIKENLDLDWDWNEIPMKDNITFRELLDIVDTYNIILTDIHWIVISSHKYITWNTVKEYKYLSWNWKTLSYNPNITYKIIIENPHYKWYWRYFTYNPNFKLEYILEKPDANWDWEHISEYYLTTDFFEKYTDFPYCNNSILMNSNFSFRYLINNSRINIHMDYLTMNNSIRLQDIRNNLHLDWDWYWLSSSTFEMDKKIFMEKHIRRWLAAYRIQQWFQKIRHNPHYKFGRKHIMALYDNSIG